MSETEGYTPEPAAVAEPVKEPAKPKRGRPKRSETVKRERRRRKGSGREADMKLVVPEAHKNPDYEYRWLRNEPGRIRQKTIEDDYDLVQDEATVSEGNQVGLGVIPERHGGTKKNGESYNMVLARKPRDYYEADQKEKQSELDATEAQLKRGVSQSPEGLAGPTAYVPEGGTNIEHKRG